MVAFNIHYIIIILLFEVGVADLVKDNITIYLIAITIHDLNWDIFSPFFSIL